MKVAELLGYSKSVLAGAVKLSQRVQFVDGAGKNWHDWVQAQPAGKKLSDPRKYSPEQLAEFLASLSSQKPDPRSPNKPLVKPQKLLKSYLPWLVQRVQQDKAIAAAGRANEQQQQQLKADRVWQLMQRTRAHPRFHQSYNFNSFEKGWVCSTDRWSADGADGSFPTPGGPWQLLGVDCEMCKTAANDKELLQVAVVDEQGKLLMQELVLPSDPVLDFRTELTGITASHLEGVTLNRKAAAKRLSKLLTPHTVLVGHGLNNDLRALQLDHPWVIDTSMVYSFKGLSSFVPSLALLAEQVLGTTLRGGEPSAPLSTSQPQQQHDSREDASTALALVKHERQREGATPVLDAPELKVDKEDLTKLCVHRLPATAPDLKDGSSSDGSVSEAVVTAVKASLAAACRQAGAAAAADALEAAAVEQPGRSRFSNPLLYLVFKHAGVANDVFGALPGAVYSDSLGRHSKRQAMAGSRHQVVVRKMACHNGLAFGRDKPADRGAKEGSKKKRKVAGSGSKRSSRQHTPKKSRTT